MSTLYVVATPIGNLEDMTPRAISVLSSVSLIAAEDTRHSGKLLRVFGIETPTISYHHHNRAQRAATLLQRLAQGDVALISDAGTPAIADPGYELVAAAAEAGHTIVPVPGASALVAAVSASGLVPGPFTFLGFLPRSGEDRRTLLGRALTGGVPVVLFESPLRAAATLREVDQISPGRTCVVARELTKLHEEFFRGSVAGLAAELESATPRGEVVIVVGPNPMDGTGDDLADAERMAVAILEQGVKPSRAARELAAILGMDSAEAYAVIQRVRDRRSSN